MEPMEHYTAVGRINKLFLSVHCFQTKGEEETLVSMEQEQMTGTPSVQEGETGRTEQVTPGTAIMESSSYFYRYQIKSSHPYPKTVFLILGSKFFERLSFLAMNSILSLYINHVLMFDQNRSTTIYHSFTMLCYICPLVGAVMADQFLGKFKTIVYMSLIFLLGHLLKTLAAIPTLGVPQV